MARKQIGGQPARYSFLLNPYSDVRLSKCPTCHWLTNFRKFALFIHAEEWGPLTLGKTCRYCTRCEMIIAHKDELDAEMARCLAQLAPAAAGKEYLVVGTVDRKVWKRGLGGKPQQLDEALEHLAQFQKYLQLEVDPGSWRPKKE